MMDKSFIEKMLELAGEQIVEVNGRYYSNQNLTLIREPEIKPVKLSGLKGLIDIIDAECKKLPDAVLFINTELFINIDSETHVTVFGLLNDYFRHTYYTAVPELPQIERKLNGFMPLENMIIFLMTNFIETEDRDYLIKLFSNITDEKSVKMTDDGLSQTVNAKQGIALAEKTTVKKIVTLKPYRTFLEAEQPEEKFLPRLDANGNAALFAADGGMWKIQAKKNIRDYLHVNISDGYKNIIKILD